MTDNNRMPGKIHQGRNIKRLREMLGIKQESLAHELGADWSQKKISLLEQKETVEEAILTISLRTRWKPGDMKWKLFRIRKITVINLAKLSK